VNPINTDSYKIGHYLFYPDGLENQQVHVLSRGGRYKEVVQALLQYKLKKYFVEDPATVANVTKARTLLQPHFGADVFNYDGFMHIVQDHGGHMPLHIRAMPEGSVVPVKNALMTIEATCPKCAWAPTYVDPILTQDWYPDTVATNSREIKKLQLRYLEQTGDPTKIDFMLHDFGFRGASSRETAAIGGAAHLINYLGSDNLPALELLWDYYGVTCAGHSLLATEHSVMTMEGEEGELETARRVLRRAKEKGVSMVAQVGDSYDIERFVNVYVGKELRKDIAIFGGKLIVRPDSGYPAHSVRDVLKGLDQAFGSVRNHRGYKVLPSIIGMIQGDGNTYDVIDEVSLAVKYNGFSTENVPFGMGGELLQNVRRDDQKFAAKTSWRQVNGVGKPVFKQPKGDATKASQAGYLVVVRTEEGLKTLPIEQAGDVDVNLLKTVYLDGKVTETPFDQIRQRAAVPVQNLLPLAV
jgi:nicotinamide phosphoribosyltransferase